MPDSEFLNDEITGLDFHQEFGIRHPGCEKSIFALRPKRSADRGRKTWT
jgi:hypothetical protein